MAIPISMTMARARSLEGKVLGGEGGLGKKKSEAIQREKNVLTLLFNFHTFKGSKEMTSL